MWRNTNRPGDWKSLGIINDTEILFDKLSLKGAKFNFKLTESTDSGKATIKSIEFPEGILVYDSSV